eukprot:Anaeramoba_flamelloidesa348174_109.p1 GENE.a348174_109~~a348174_109.p1  ORF type:complete len:152 (+),score=14.54 a348174_109:292-747(+)
MSLKEQLKDDLKAAMRAKEIVKRDAIRAINTMIKQIEVDKGLRDGEGLSDEEIISLIQKGVKTRNESITQYKEAGREDLIEKEQEQIDVFSLYLPKQLSDEELESEIKAIIEQTGASSMKDMGKIMGPAKAKIGASADGKRINEMVKKILG